MEAIFHSPFATRPSSIVLAMHPHPSFGDERQELFASKK